MDILFISDNFPPESNAPATRLYEHATRWVRDGHGVTVITCAPNFPNGKVYPGYRNAWRTVEEVAGIRVIRVKTYISPNRGRIRRSIDYASFMVMSFIMGLFERRHDVVVATSPQILSAVSGWALSVAKRRPFVFELRDIWPVSFLAVGVMERSLIFQRLEALELFLYRRAKTIVAVTESFRAELAARGIDRNKIHVVLNGVDLDRYAPRERDAALADEFKLHGKFVAGYVGTLGMSHALSKVLEAAEYLKNDQGIAFLIVGAGAERANLERMIDGRKLENVRLLPNQPKERMPAIWSLCSVAIVPLRDSPVFASVIPSKIFECMGMGVPVLMSIPRGEATRIVEDAGMGICVPPESPHKLAEAIVRMAGDPEGMRAYRKAAREAAPRFSRDVLAQEMSKVLAAAAGI